MVNLCSCCDPALAFALDAQRVLVKRLGANRHPLATACPYLLIVQGALPPGDPVGLPVVLVVDPLPPPVQLLVLVVVVGRCGARGRRAEQVVLTAEHAHVVRRVFERRHCGALNGAESCR